MVQKEIRGQVHLKRYVSTCFEKRLGGLSCVVCASAIQAVSCTWLPREELCGTGAEWRVRVCGEVHGWTPGSSPPVHVGMCRMNGARSIAERRFSFAALK